MPALGLIALVVAFLLLMTRLSVRRRKKDAAGLFPEITPAPTPSPGPEGTNPAAERSASPAGQAADGFTGAPATPALGLIALAAAFLLVMTRLFVRRRKNRRGPGA
jgi:F0F1-type ATP synthase membrane subunit c/vacuolar-type H+-ATPase subunit K